MKENINIHIRWLKKISKINKSIKLIYIGNNNMANTRHNQYSHTPVCCFLDICSMI